MISKQSGWQQRLHEQLEAVRKQPFEWGRHDCAFFAAHAIDRMCVTNFAARLRVDLGWRDAAGAARVLASIEGGLTALVSDYLGEPSPRNLCREGDVMEVEVGGHRSLGIHEGHAVVAVGEEGRVIVPLELAMHGWRLG